MARLSPLSVLEGVGSGLNESEPSHQSEREIEHATRVANDEGSSEDSDDRGRGSK